MPHPLERSKSRQNRLRKRCSLEAPSWAGLVTDPSPEPPRMGTHLHNRWPRYPFLYRNPKCAVHLVGWALCRVCRPITASRCGAAGLADPVPARRWVMGIRLRGMRGIFAHSHTGMCGHQMLRRQCRPNSPRHDRHRQSQCQHHQSGQ